MIIHLIIGESTNSIIEVDTKIFNIDMLANFMEFEYGNVIGYGKLTKYLNSATVDIFHYIDPEMFYYLNYGNEGLAVDYEVFNIVDEKFMMGLFKIWKKEQHYNKILNNPDMLRKFNDLVKNYKVYIREASINGIIT